MMPFSVVAHLPSGPYLIHEAMSRIPAYQALKKAREEYPDQHISFVSRHIPSVNVKTTNSIAEYLNYKQTMLQAS